MNIRRQRNRTYQRRRRRRKWRRRTKRRRRRRRTWRRRRILEKNVVEEEEEIDMEGAQHTLSQCRQWIYQSSYRPTSQSHRVKGSPQSVADNQRPHHWSQTWKRVISKARDSRGWKWLQAIASARTLCSQIIGPQRVQSTVSATVLSAQLHQSADLLGLQTREPMPLGRPKRLGQTFEEARL